MSDTSSIVSVPSTAGSGKGKTISQRIKESFADGRIHCTTPTHYTYDVATKRLVNVAWGQIFYVMMPGASAKCRCEMEALDQARRRQRSGTLTTAWVPDGHYQKGIPGFCKVGEPVKKVIKLGYTLGERDLRMLAEEFPHYYILTGNRAHDHHVAHTRTKFATWGLVDALPGGPTGSPRRYLDLYGNPASNAATNARRDDLVVDTVVERCTPKDFIRAAEKWGDWENDAHVSERTVRDYTVNAGDADKQWLGQYHGFLAFHTLYYIQRNELASLLSARKGSMLRAIVHRFPGMSGTLNNGEQTYTKRCVHGKWYVTQTNTKTGESYEHPDIEWLFEHDSWVESETSATPGFGWTINMICPDTYEIKMVSVPRAHVLMSGKCLVGEQGEVDGTSIEALLDTGVVEMDVCGEVVTVSGVAPKAFTEMKLVVSGKARTAEQYKDHLASTKRKMKATKETDRDAAATAIASFLVNFNQDMRLTNGTLGLNLESARRLEATIRGDAPASARNYLDKAFVVMGVLAAAKSNAPEKTVQTFARLGRELLASNGTRASV